MENIKIKRHYTVIGHSKDVVELRWGIWNPVSFTISDDSESGKLFAIVKRLDGTTSVSRIAKEEEVSKSDIEAVIDQLSSLGVIEKGASNALDHYLDTCIPSLGRPESLLKPIKIVGDSPIASQLKSLLVDAFPNGEITIASNEDEAYKILCKNDTSWLYDGIKFFETLHNFQNWKDSFVVFAFANINPLQMRIMNKVSLHLNIPWMHSAIDGAFLLIGPTFEPKKASCFECFETRLLMNMRESASYIKYKNALLESKVIFEKMPYIETLYSILASHVALEVINYLKAKNNFTLGRVLTIHLPTMEFNYNEILTVPSCTSCGSIPERDDQELYFDLSAFIEKQEV